jgi:hypothetical protein
MEFEFDQLGKYGQSPIFLLPPCLHSFADARSAKVLVAEEDILAICAALGDVVWNVRDDDSG